MLFRELNKNYRGRHIVKKYSEDTCDSYEDILLTKGGLFPIYPFLDIIVLPKRTKLTSKICDNFQIALDSTTLEVVTKNARKRAVRIFLMFMEHEGYIKTETGVFDRFVQEAVPEKDKAVLTPQQRDVLDNSDWSKNYFINLRNKVIYGILRRHGDRPELELHKCNRNFIDTRLWIIKIIGKGGKIRHHRLFPDEIPIIKEYLTELHKHVSAKPGYPDEEALFPRMHPEMDGRSKGEAVWRLDRPGIYAIYDRMRDKNPILKGTNPYSSRHTRITHVHLICEILGVALEHASKIFGNEIITRMRSYDHGSDLLEELLCKDFDTELAPILFEISAYCDLKLKENPGFWVYELCKERIRDILKDVALRKVTIGRSPSLREFYESDSENDYYAMWEKNENKDFLGPIENKVCDSPAKTIVAPPTAPAAQLPAPCLNMPTLQEPIQGYPIFSKDPDIFGRYSGTINEANDACINQAFKNCQTDSCAGFPFFGALNEWSSYMVN
jgi:site-specific recombinase XerD